MRRYQSRVFAVTYRYLRNAEEARDAAQDVFIRVYRRLSTFDGGESFLPWLLQLTRNACIDRLRRAKARPAEADSLALPAAEIADTAPGPEASSEAESRKRLLYRALDRMSEPHREIILLKEIQGLKLEELSRMLGLPIGTVKSRSSRARIELAAMLQSLDASYGVRG